MYCLVIYDFDVVVTTALPYVVEIKQWFELDTLNVGFFTGF